MTLFFYPLVVSLYIDQYIQIIFEGFKMVAIAWYIGIFGNIVLVLIFSLVSLQLLYSDYKKSNTIQLETIFSILPLIIFVSMILCVVSLYWESFISHKDYTEATTIMPQLMWIGNLFYFGFLFLAIAYAIKVSKFVSWIIFLLYSCVGLINGLNLGKYTVLWRDGNVLVYYINKEAETINSILNIGILALTFYLVFSNALESTNVCKIVKQRSKWLTIACFISLLTFFIPRTESWSITNPVNVKIIGYIFFYGFLLAYSIAWGYSNKINSYLSDKFTEIYSLEKQQSLKKIILLVSREERKFLFLEILSIMGILLVVLILIFGESFVRIYAFADEAVSDSMAFFIGEYLGIKWYFHIIGVIVPLIVGLILFTSLFVFNNTNKSHFRIFFVFFSLEFGLSFLFNNILGFGLGRNESYSPFVLGFLIPPILICYYFLLTQTSFLTENMKNKQLVREFLNSIVPLREIISASILSTILIDLTHPISSTGKILIGGASFMDGIFLIPVLVASLALFIILTSIFTLKESLVLKQLEVKGKTL